uniref:Potassium channel toxin alpha-KTx Tx790 n=1 Tax=Buthus israelis TaxID=2899555 RepID=KA23M_BUTIS|nr:RecName: Full=Potassium channel toxin alpha-KTx Tx790; Flags: Precursor [Buthus occitanus israelis]ACJ23156.1 putative potassium channel toxin Tx790 [Buthus occitanus israelis]
MQKLFIVLVLFCILRLDAEVDGLTVSLCNQSECQEKCKKENKNGKCIQEIELNWVYNICKCF